MPDYMFLLESRLSAEQRAAATRVQELAAEAGANVYLVGGAVRDLISGMPIRDLDFTLEGNPFRVAHELEKGGAKILSEEESLRHVEMIFSGDVDGSIAAARDEVYHRPGTRPETRWSTIMEDLRRRDFSLNAIAISLNPASRGLLLDPTNGLADLEKHEVRALSIHSFTNQPVRLLRALRYCARMGFKMETRTAEWFALAMERGLHENIPPECAGKELQQVAREQKAVAVLKSWESHALISALHPQLARRHPHYDALHRILRVREDMQGVGYRARLFRPITWAVLGRLKARERSTALRRMCFRSAEVDAVLHLEGEAKKIVKVLAGRKTAAPRDAFAFLEKAPRDMIAFILAEVRTAKAVAKIRKYLHKWRPLRLELAAAATELESLGMPRGPKFDKVLEDLFQQQILGKGRKPEERTKLLRKLAGIKEPRKKKAKEEKKKPVVKPVGKDGKKKGKQEQEAQEATAAAPERAPVPAGTPQAGRAPAAAGSDRQHARGRQRPKTPPRKSKAGHEAGRSATKPRAKKHRRR